MIVWSGDLEIEKERRGRSRREVGEEGEGREGRKEKRPKVSFGFVELCFELAAASELALRVVRESPVHTATSSD